MPKSTIDLLYFAHGTVGSVLSISRVGTSPSSLGDTHTYHVETYARATRLMKMLESNDDKLNISSSAFECVKLIVTPTGLSVWLRRKSDQIQKRRQTAYRIDVYDEKLKPVGQEPHDDWSSVRQRVKYLKELGYSCIVHNLNERGEYEKFIQPNY